jgi:hypothetical protein
MKGIPNKIYLQVGDDKNDIEYIRVPKNGGLD